MFIDRNVVEQRSNELLELRLGGAEMPQLKQYAERQGWGVTSRTLYRYVKIGDKLLAKTLEHDRELLVNKHVAQRRRRYQKAMDAGDLSTALRILQDEAELLSLYPEKRGRLTIPEGGLVLNIVEELILNQPPQAALPAPVATEAITDASLSAAGTGHAEASAAPPGPA
jgi:hypothetical protein